MSGVQTLSVVRHVLKVNGATVQTLAGGAQGPEGGQGETGEQGLPGTDIAGITNTATSKATPVDADEMPLADSAAAFGLKKLTWANLKAAVWSVWGALIAAGTTKATPVDADAIALMDSAASNATKKLTWANLKATLFTSPTFTGTGTFGTSVVVPAISSASGTLTINSVLKQGSYVLGNASFGVLFNNATDTLNVARFNNDATVDFFGHVRMIAASTNTFDLGSLTQKWRAVYVGTSVETPAVKFPATQVPSSDANTLDDYEEGTFTPGITFGGLSTGVAYTTQSGTYTKVGRAVHFRAYVALSAKGSATGSLMVTGLPFTAANIHAPVSVWGHAVSGVGGAPQGYVTPSSTTVTLTYLNTATGMAATLADTNFTNTTELMVSGTYFV